MKKANSKITEQEINDLINEETWLTGEEASAYFDIQIEGNVSVDNCISNYFDKYNIPKNKAVRVDKNSKTAFFNTINKPNKIENEKPIIDEAIKIMIDRINKL